MAAIIASGNFIRYALRNSAVFSFIGCSNSITNESEMKLLSTSISLSVAVFQQRSSISVIEEIIGCSFNPDFAIGPYYNSQLLQTQAFA